MEPLPEFRVVLQRLKLGESAYPADCESRHSVLGCRTKLGGKPDWEQGPREEHPRCPHCNQEMTFVAQIDSVEHQNSRNPHGVDWRTNQQKWMFGDVGMIYVFYCFKCLAPVAVSECG